MAGRPSEYTVEAAAAICAEIACGKSVREICRADEMPAMSTIFSWLSKHSDFAEQYVRAREAQADYLAEELLEIADDGSNDWMERQGKDGETSGYVVNGEAVQRSKLRVDARKWLMSKLQPKKYGDKLQAELTGKDGGPIQTEDANPLETARRVAFLLASGAESAKDEAG